MSEQYDAAKKASVAYLQDLVMHWESQANYYFQIIHQLRQANITLRTERTERTVPDANSESVHSHQVTVWQAKLLQTETDLQKKNEELQNKDTELQKKNEELEHRNKELQDIKDRLRVLFSHTRSLIALANYHEKNSSQKLKKTTGNDGGSEEQYQSESKNKKRNYTEKRPLKEALSDVYAWFKDGKPLNYEIQGRRPLAAAKIPLAQLMQISQDELSGYQHILPNVKGNHGSPASPSEVLGKRTGTLDPLQRVPETNQAPSTAVGMGLPPSRIILGYPQQGGWLTQQHTLMTERREQSRPVVQPSADLKPSSPHEKYWDPIMEKYKTPAQDIVTRVATGSTHQEYREPPRDGSN